VLRLNRPDYATYGSFTTHQNKDDWHNSTGPSETYKKNFLLQQCCREFGIEYISVYGSLYIDIKFGFLHTMNQDMFTTHAQNIKKKRKQITNNIVT
jgi:hypothetical protein